MTTTPGPRTARAALIDALTRGALAQDRTRTLAWTEAEHAALLLVDRAEADARADVDGLATPEGYAERYATGYEAGRKDAARDIRRAVMKLAYTTVDVTDTSEGWEAVPRASVLALVAPLLAGDKAEAPE